VAHAASGGHALARALLALAAPMTNGHGYYGRGPVTGLVAATPARAQGIALTLAIAGIKHRTGTHARPDSCHPRDPGVMAGR
jgi:hypothetical protein